MKKVFFLLAILFAFTITASATTETVDNKPPKGYNYNKAVRKAASYNFFKAPKRHNGGCGWARTRK